VLEPIVATLDDLAEALGDDHDLAVLVELLAGDPHQFGGGLHALRVIDVARAKQADLRRRAFRLGASVYAESPAAFTRRMESYWDRTVRDGPELATGGIAELAAEERHAVGAMAHDPEHTIERERKYLVAELPPLPEAGTELRQGYLALDGGVSVRLREAAGEACVLTIKAGRGDTRTEVEWPVSGDQFAVMWEQTRGRRIRKTRYWIPLESHHVELDVFHDDLSGLVMAEVELDSEASMAAFTPPPWFGREVTDDLDFTNASLAVNAPHGRPVSEFVRPRPRGAIA
jgi:CYTH domain-containing protein